MGLGEHVLDLFTGPDIPVRHIVGDHVCLPLRPVVTFALGHGTLSDSLHDLEGFLGIQPLADQVDHDIVTGTDGRGNGGFSFQDQRLGIAQPYVRSVG